ncbi:hypothetical protein [Marinimicrobium sp. ARAG 43.8]|uniref:hypothetical protein n=1 Tax=Marinimicrobium sp. ARAG 43.8 TaxID=3418719 RepID=UPI003CEACD07
MRFTFLRVLWIATAFMALVSCATAPTLTDQFGVYKKNIELRDNPEALKIAEQALINIVENPYTSVEMQENVQQMLASHYIAGKFGYFSEDKFRYWLGREGERLGEYYVRTDKKIDSFYEAYQSDPGSVSATYEDSYDFCDEDMRRLLASPDLDQIEDNKALHYLSATDCVKYVVSDSVEARHIMSEYFSQIGISKEDEQRAIGFSIISDKKFTVNQLSADQYEPVAHALTQIVNFSERKLLSCYGKVPSSVVALGNTSFDLARSGNLEDREKAYRSLDAVMTESQYSDMDRVCMLFFVSMGAAVAEDMDKFYKGVQELITYQALIDRENWNYIVDAGMRFLVKHEEFATAIEFFNESGFPMSSESSKTL